MRVLTPPYFQRGNVNICFLFKIFQQILSPQLSESAESSTMTENYKKGKGDNYARL